LLAEERTLVALPDELTYLDGSMIACGLGTASAACERANVSGRDVVLITGLGPVGLGTALLCQKLGARVIGVEAIPEHIELAKKLGIDEMVNPTDERASERPLKGRGSQARSDIQRNAGGLVNRAPSAR
jgi:D-arabinose 1-dehydrogenase-like Zn-dependent alcohol dehydrogenase